MVVVGVVVVGVVVVGVVVVVVGVDCVELGVLFSVDDFSVEVLFTSLSLLHLTKIPRSCWNSLDIISKCTPSSVICSMFLFEALTSESGHFSSRIWSWVISTSFFIRSSSRLAEASYKLPATVAAKMSVKLSTTGFNIVL